MKSTHSHPILSAPIPPNAHQPTLIGIPIKYISLISLTLQNSLLTILLHYSRTATDNKVYSAPAAVLLSEILKSLISFAIAILNSTRLALHPTPLTPNSPHPPDRSSLDQDGPRSDRYFYPDPHHAYRLLSTDRVPTPLLTIIRTQIRLNLLAIFSRDCWKLSIPAILYVVQNNLQFVAASHLDVATFSVTYQLKILTTALCSVLILRRRLSILKWISLFFLAVGVALVQVQNVTPQSTSSTDGPSMNRSLGFIAVSLACFTSGLAGVYFELVLKSSNKVDLWIRNVQLSLFSILPALSAAMAASSSSSEPMFAHFGFWAWATVLTQVIGGLVTALVIKFADNILKGFATSLSIILSTFASVVLFNTALPFGSALGASIVLMSAYSYNISPNDSSSSPIPISSRTSTTSSNWTEAGNEKIPSPPAVVIDFTRSSKLDRSHDDNDDDALDQDDYRSQEAQLLAASAQICPSPQASHFPLSAYSPSSTSCLSPRSPTADGFFSPAYSARTPFNQS